MFVRLFESIFSSLKDFYFKNILLSPHRTSLGIVSLTFLLQAFLFQQFFPDLLAISVQYFYFAAFVVLVMAYGVLFGFFSLTHGAHIFTIISITAYFFVVYESLQNSSQTQDTIVFFSMMHLFMTWPFHTTFVYVIYNSIYFLLLVGVILFFQFPEYQEYALASRQDLRQLLLYYFCMMVFLILGRFFLYQIFETNFEKYNFLEQQLKENRKEHFKLYRRAYYDFLTGLYNRMMMEEQIRYSIQHAAEDQTSLGLLFVDLDDFKSINDRYGHKAGDECLMEAARRFTTLFSKSKTIDEQHNFVARIAGDEFIVVLVGVSKQRMQRLCKELLESCKPLVALPSAEEKVKITFSIGAYLMPFKKKENKEIFEMGWKELRILLFTISDRNMYRAKKNKNTYYMTTYSKQDYNTFKELGIEASDKEQN